MFFSFFFDFSKFFLLQIWTPKSKLLEHFFFEFSEKSSKIFYNLLKHSELFENVRKCQKFSREIRKWLKDKPNHDFPNPCEPRCSEFRFQSEKIICEWKMIFWINHFNDTLDTVKSSSKGLGTRKKRSVFYRKFSAKSKVRQRLNRSELF